jgi:hypothetical protein
VRPWQRAAESDDDDAAGLRAELSRFGLDI